MQLMVGTIECLRCSHLSHLVADLRCVIWWLSTPKMALQWLQQPYVGIFGVESHQMMQHQSAIQWLKWLHYKVANVDLRQTIHRWAAALDDDLAAASIDVSVGPRWPR